MPAFAPKPARASMKMTVLREPGILGSCCEIIEKSKLPVYLKIKENMISSSRPLMWVMMRYMTPAFMVSLFLYSNITRKNEDKDMISQKTMKLRALREKTTPSMESRNKIRISAKYRREYLPLYSLIYPVEYVPMGIAISRITAAKKRDSTSGVKLDKKYEWFKPKPHSFPISAICKMHTAA